MPARLCGILLALPILLAADGCGHNTPPPASREKRAAPVAAMSAPEPVSDPVRRAVVEGALEQTRVTRNYDPSYVVMAYPGGDVPPETGVCADVIVRAFRRGGEDLQPSVHEDMRAHFDAYPQAWGLRGPDRNIDHRRVPNLRTFFTRKGAALPVTRRAADYRPGDVVAWQLASGREHIGLVSHVRADGGARYLIVHNIGAGARLEDVLFRWRILGHYRWFR